MRGPLVVLFSGLILAGALVAGCGGGGGGASAPLIPGHSTQGNTLVQVSLFIPQKTSQGKRVPKYVSPSTQSALIEIIGPIPSTSPSAVPSGAPTAIPSIPPIVGVGYTNFNSQTCTGSGAGETCNVSINASITQAGAYGIAVVTSDQPQTAACTFVMGSTPPPSPTPVPSGGCVGYALGLNIAEVNITPGSVSSISIALGGVPVYFQPVKLVSGMIGGHGGTLQVFGPTPASASFELLDADKNIIIGPNPLQLTVINPFSTMTVNVTNTPSPAGLYTLTVTPITTAVGGQNVISPTTATLTMNAAITSNFTTQASPAPITVGTFPFGVQLLHSVVAVAKSGGAIDVFLDGKTSSPSYTIGYSNCGSPLGIAIDPQENLWAADQCAVNNDIVVWQLALSAPGSPPGQSVAFCGIGGGTSCSPTSTSFKYPQYVAFDASGDLLVSQGTSASGSSVMQYNAPSATATPNPAGAAVTTYLLPPGATYFCHLAASNNGNFYVGSDKPAIVQFGFGTGTGTLLNSTNINGIAWGQDNTLWYLSQPTSPATETIFDYNPTTMTATSIVTGIFNSPAQSIAVDMLGNLYVADGSTPGATMYTPPSYTSPTSLGSSVAPIFVAVYPDGLYGSNHQVGIAQPTQSPFPIASPPVL